MPRRARCTSGRWGRARGVKNVRYSGHSDGNGSSRWVCKRRRGKMRKLHCWESREMDGISVIRADGEISVAFDRPLEWLAGRKIIKSNFLPAAPGRKALFVIPTRSGSRLMKLLSRRWKNSGGGGNSARRYGTFFFFFLFTVPWVNIF